MRSRAYAGADDFALLVEFVRDATAARWPGSACWHVGDVVWRMFQNTVFDPLANIRLWIDDGRLVAVAWFEPPLHVEFDIRPGVDLSVAQEMLAWSESRGRELGAQGGVALDLSTTAFDADRARIALLGRNGYARTERHTVRMRRALDVLIPESSLPDGMRLRHATDADVVERVDIHRDAWSVWGPSSVTVDAYRRLRAAPDYRPDLDIVVETAGGRFASSCICWVDTVNGVGEFEPVGTRPEFKGRGLARATIFEGLRRLRDRGMHTALVQTASINDRALALYRSCGFDVIEREHFYVKRIA